MKLYVLILDMPIKVYAFSLWQPSYIIQGSKYGYLLMQAFNIYINIMHILHAFGGLMKEGK